MVAAEAVVVVVVAGVANDPSQVVVDVDVDHHVDLSTCGLSMTRRREYKTGRR